MDNYLERLKSHLKVQIKYKDSKEGRYLLEVSAKAASNISVPSDFEEIKRTKV